jgi:hypothetical protein
MMADEMVEMMVEKKDLQWVEMLVVETVEMMVDL